MEREERKSKRSLVLNPVKYFLVPSIVARAYNGVIVDVSDSGICLLTTSHLKDRQRIIIQDDADLSEKAAIVRWSQKYEDTLYKVGVEFIEDQIFMNIRDKRRYRRLNVENLDIRCEMASANYITIVEMSLGGLLIETDARLKAGEGCTLHLEHEGRGWLLKGYIVRSILKKWKEDGQNNRIPIYSVGIKNTSALSEIQGLLRSIGLIQKEREKDGYLPSDLGKDIRGKDKKHLEGCINSR
ncbi:MAG: hypothetical protein AB1442_02735 [Nitrospirota bacterium]